jgi:MULE transposase domain
MALDACHLRSRWKGTMYLATVKSPLDKIVPVAIGLSIENKNYTGRKCFLEHLGEAIPMMTQPHYLPRVTYSYFTFVSDRDKGIEQALSEVFPNNLSTHCVIHILHNVWQKIGIKASTNVARVAATFSARMEEELLKETGNVSQRARNYLEDIEKYRWRSSEWVHDRSLPPQFGILNSNIAESTNSMFEGERNGTWLDTIETILDIMCKRILTLREESKGEKGVNATTAALLRKRWEACAG